jgi:hypothetical protein
LFLKIVLNSIEIGKPVNFQTICKRQPTNVAECFPFSDVDVVDDALRLLTFGEPIYNFYNLKRCGTITEKKFFNGQFFHNKGKQRKQQQQIIDITKSGR